ncbi:hypothetical protein ACFO3C_06370 [Halostagnicola sp. GCM10023398]|uniref:hypothetical protein n=1 Tax=Halostagnicola sp. GCM10023398 TaxID=3252683 RepID=UPI00360FDF4C
MIRWTRGLWTFYLAYTKTGVHAASAAAFAIFGLLVFVDSLFAALAIGSYVLPPVVLYVLADDPIDEYVRDESPVEAMVVRDASRLAEETTTDGGAGETDRTTIADEGGSSADRSAGDTDSDSDDGDTDSDSDDGDTDSDSDDGDTDSDSDS